MTISIAMQEKARLRCQARLIAGMVKDEVEIVGPNLQDVFLRMVREEIDARFPPPRVSKDGKQKLRQIEFNTTEECPAIEQCDRIIELCQDVPEEGQDFAESVIEKVESIREWAESHGGDVTDHQQSALDNMEGAVGNWINHE